MTASGDTIYDSACVGRWPLDTVMVAPGRATAVSRPAFVPARVGQRGQVTFTIDPGHVQELTAVVQASCPGAGTQRADINTAAGTQRADINTAAGGHSPAPLTRGRFTTSGVATGADGQVVHYRVEGRVEGQRASGTLDG